MKPIFKIVVALIGLFILINGVMFMFNPEFGMNLSHLSASNTFGISTVRAIIGGSMLATGLLTLLAIVTSKSDLLHSAVVILLAWTLGRVISLFADGFDKEVFIGGILISLLMAVLLTISHKVLSKEVSN
ncbi:MAG: DUF4345 family protein [Bacteroidota bacterium]